MSYTAIFKGGPDNGLEISIHDELSTIYIPEPVDHSLIVHEYRLVEEISGNFLIYKWVGSSE